MNTLDSQQKRNINRVRRLITLFLVIICAFININIVLAQRANFSDWHVPPPLSPGNTTKGNTTGKDAKSSLIALVPVDIPAPQLPKGPPVQIPQGISISVSAPAVVAPEQPVATGTTSVPSPAAPDAPAMPQLQLQDLQAAAIAMPDPVVPELPSVPAEPLPSKTMNVNTKFPVMPAMIGRVSIVFPADAIQSFFPTPAMPENNRGNISMPPATENDKKDIKPKKTKPTKNKPNRHR